MITIIEVISDILTELKYIPIKLKRITKIIYLIIKTLRNKVTISIRVRTRVRKAKLFIKIYYKVSVLKFVRLNIRKSKIVRVLILKT